MVNRSTAAEKLIGRRILLKCGAALAASASPLVEAATTMTIDSQVHAYEANTPKRPWATVPNWPAHVTGDEMVAAMDNVGVDGAVLVSPMSMYRYDASYV